ncbi:unnamed protein product [Somion occarium]|uniref:Alcohol dehydrogenase iron-type/glycerol dehydrogenase GldA domain-containing protein n=1 Tax=Somion occarium TaxID=3059160 RepID=A0ABP1CTX1_9APHY
MPHNPNKVTERLFQSPSKYIQGPSAFHNAAKYLEPLGKAPLLTCDAIVYKIAGKQLIDSLQAANLKVTYAEFGGEITTPEISRLQKIAQDNTSDFIIGVGGGKTLDCVKAIAAALQVPVASLPTIAATDAPCSAVSVVYTPEGHFDHYKFLKNPDIVLLDTSVIAQAPARFLAAGMGDAIATHVEAKTCRQSVNPGGGLPAELSTAIGEKCEETLFKYGKLAYEANKLKAVTPAFEAVVEANTLLSGLGFESGGVAAAHSIHNGFTAIEALHALLHGEKGAALVSPINTTTNMSRR